jgi:50S ribosomal protein L16 3-hydroxylase
LVIGIRAMMAQRAHGQWRMDITRELLLLGGLSPAAFMRRHWHKRPLLVRGAVPGIEPPLSRGELFALAARDDVESRLVEQLDGQRWRVRQGPFGRRTLPPLARAGWSLLVQGLDLHVDAAHELLARFRFVPEARLDDLMVSYASDGGGVGPHFDSYDVFLIQVQGRRRWRVGRSRDLTLRDDVPLKILANFEPEEEWLLEPGDLLYLPPRWAHDGVADGECMTCSVGFRAPSAHELAREVLQRLLEGSHEPMRDPRYRDPAQAASATPGRVPDALQAFARQAVARLLADPRRLDEALGELLSEPKPAVWFTPDRSIAAGGRGVRLDRRTRMLYDTRHIYINGEAFVASGRDATLMRRLADARGLAARDVAALSAAAHALLDDWALAGWLRQAG